MLCIIPPPFVDLYSGIIAKELKQPLYVKSWGKMRNPLPSNCSIPYDVYNVKEVKIPGGKPFKDTVDHSKWCVAPKGGWTCIADMNREKSQMDRGGGAICTDDVAVRKAFYTLIAKHDPCKRERSHSNAQRREL